METTFVADPDIELRREGEHHVLRVRCIPYGVITHKAGARPERFRAGAFATAPANAGKIRLRDANHAKERLPVGVAQTLDDRQDGLYGEYRVYNTPEGRAALENVKEGVYTGVSVGFYAEDEDLVDGVREVRRAQLHHVSLVEEPAYDDARILAVRSADRYAAALRKPDMSILELPDDDTPMTVRLERMLGNVRVGA